MESNDEKKASELERLADFVHFLYSCPGLKNEKYRPSVTVGRPKRGKGTGPNGSKQMSQAIELDSLRMMKINEWAFPIPGHESLEMILKKALNYKFTEVKRIKHSNFEELRNNSEILKSQIRSLERKNEDGEFSSQIEEYKQALKIVETKMSEFVSEKIKDDTAVVDNQKNLIAAKILRIFDAARREEYESKKADDDARQGHGSLQKISTNARNKASKLYKCIYQKMFPHSEECVEHEDHRGGSGRYQGKPTRFSDVESNWRTAKPRSDISQSSANVYIPPHAKMSTGEERRYNGFRPEHEIKERREFHGDKREHREVYQKKDFSDRTLYKSTGDSRGSVKYVPPHLREQKQDKPREVLDTVDDLDISQDKFPSLMKSDHSEEKQLTGAWSISLSQEVLTRAPVKKEDVKEEGEEEDDDISSVYKQVGRKSLVKHFSEKNKSNWDDIEESDEDQYIDQSDDDQIDDDMKSGEEKVVTVSVTTMTTAWAMEDGW